MLDYENGTCALTKKGNESDPFHLGNTYGGLPTNLITNGIGWVLLMLAFIFLRKSAWKFLRRGGLDSFPNKSEQNPLHRLIELFFTDTGQPNASTGGTWNPGLEESAAASPEAGGDPHQVDNSSLNHLHNGGPIQEHPYVSGRLIAEETDLEETEPAMTPRLQRQQSSRLLLDKESFWQWLGASVVMGDEQLNRLAGPDAVQYLRFQKYLLVFVSIVTLLCICIILPFNFQGNKQGTEVDFGHTTLANLDPDSSYLYAHITIAFLLFPIAIFIMRRFSESLGFRDTALEISHTLQVENIPIERCKEDLLRQHFTDAFPGVPVKDLRCAYDVSRLTTLTAQLKDASDARVYAEKHNEQSGREDLEMYPACMARYCSCFCMACMDKVDVAEYYTVKEDQLRAEVQKETDLAQHKPLGMAFVTFSSINHSKKVRDAHRRAAWWHFWCKRNPPMSPLSPSLRPELWRVSYAPLPGDIYWENLSDQREWLTAKKIIAGLLLFIIALFLTTPEYIVTQLDAILYTMFGTEDTWVLPGFIKDFLPTLLIWSFTALMPVLVAYSDRWLGHWYRSEENHSIMIKSFWYLWIIVLIFPTFGFTTGMAVIENMFGKNHTEPVFRWDCIFLPDSGAFFVNYVITSAFIGSGLELIRVPELLWYGCCLLLSRTEAESGAISRAVAVEFRFGEQYARMLLMLSMVVMYSISCPLITPFGLVYFLFKHLVDKHNLAFVYERSRINKNVHRSAINFVMFSVGLLQVFMLSFSFIRSYNGDVLSLSERTKVALFLFVLTLMVFAAQTWSNLCKKLSPIKYLDVLYAEDGDELLDSPYVPEVLLKSYEQDSPHIRVAGTPPDIGITSPEGTFQPSSPQAPNMATTGASDICVLVP